MKRAVLLAAVAALLLPNLAAAQMSGPRPDRPGDNRPGGPGNNDRPGQRPPNGGGPGMRPPGSGPGQRPPGYGPGQRPPHGGPGMRPPGPGPGMRPPGNRPPAMRPPSRPPQWNWHGRYYDRMHGPAFRYPTGYGYRRWTIGALLPGLFLGSTYYYNDWRGIGLGAPGPGRRWVRYGPDLLLVNIHTGRVVDVIYDAFY